MRFVDANIFIYAILKPKKELSKEEKEIKENSIKIFQRINKGEEVVTTASHICEISNILEDAKNLDFSISFVRDILSRRNIVIEGVDKSLYIIAVTIAEEKKMGINDALAYEIMKRKNVKEIYSFDKHFDSLPVRRITK